MRPFFARRAHVPWLGFALAGLGFVPPSAAGEPPVLVGEIQGSTPSGEFTEPLRSLVEAQLAGAELGRPRDHFVLSATLVHLDAERVGQGARASAAVSLVLRRARQQSLHAILNGHATAEEANGSVSETRADALRAAVASALRRLPEAVR